MSERRVVIPGEIVAKGDDYLLGEGVEKKDDGNIVAIKFGLAEESNKLLKIIPLSGRYHPRRGNVVIGKVEELTFNGWVIDIDSAERTFLSLTEVPRYVDKNKLDEVLDIGEMVVAKIWSINARGIDLSTKSRGLGKIDEGIIFNVNPNKVPRIIGKEGSMINLIKDNTGCNVTVGQNGFIWIKGDKIEDELYTKNAILFVAERSSSSGLTDEVKKWFEKKKK